MAVSGSEAKPLQHSQNIFPGSVLIASNSLSARLIIIALYDIPINIFITIK
jgi:hypothetical protein